MKRLLKNGKIKIFSSLFFLSVLAVMLFSVSGVFGGEEGELLSKGEVFDGNGIPVDRDVFFSDDNSFGWGYVDDAGDVYTPTKKVEYLSDTRRKVTLSGSPQWVKEDGEFKSIKDAESLKDYYVPEVLYDGQGMINHKDWNYTDVYFTVTAHDSGLVGKSVPIKIDGEVNSYAVVNKLDEESGLIHLHFDDSVFYHNWSFGFESTHAYLRSGDNSSFDDNCLRSDNPSTVYNGDYYDFWFCTPAVSGVCPYHGIAAADLESEGILGAKFVTVKFEYQFSSANNDGTADVYVLNNSWTETEATWNLNASGGIGWDGAQNATYKGSKLGSIQKFSGEGSRYNITFDADVVQESYDSDGWLRMVAIGTGSSNDVIYPSHNAYGWALVLEYEHSIPGIQGNVTTISPSSPGESFDLTCTFTPESDYFDTLDATVHWFRVGEPVPIENSKTVTTGAESSFLLDSGNTSSGQEWFCNVSVSNGYESSGWINSSKVTITSTPGNWTDYFDDKLQSNKTRDVFVWDASKETWDREDTGKSWYIAESNFPDKVYLFLTDSGLDVVDASKETVWMDFEFGTDHAIEGNPRSVHALDGKIFVASDTGLYVLDFKNDNISRYDNINGLSVSNNTAPFSNDVRKAITTGVGFDDAVGNDATKTIVSDDVNDVHANKVRGQVLVGIATADGSNVINFNDNSVDELDICTGADAQYQVSDVFIADDGTFYFAENKLDGTTAKLYFIYTVDNNLEGTVACKSTTYESYTSSTAAHFDGNHINDLYVTSGTSKNHADHNTIFVATEESVSVIQEYQDDEGRSTSQSFGNSASSADYKILESPAKNVTAITSYSDGSIMYIGTYDGSDGGWVSQVSLDSNNLVNYWNTSSVPSILGHDITSLDFLDGDLLIGTKQMGGKQVDEDELEFYLIADYTKHRVIQIDNTGLIYFEFGIYNVSGNDGTHLNNPTYAERLENGNTLIADYGNNRILKVNPDGDIVEEVNQTIQLSDATTLDGVYSVTKVNRI